MHTTDFQGLHTSKQSPSVDTYREIMCRDACWNLTLRYLHRYSSLWIHSALNNDLMNDNRPPHFSGKIASDWLTLDPASTLHVGTKPSLISSRMLRVGYVLWCMLRVKKEYGEQCPHVAALQAWCLSHRLPYFPPPPRISRWYVYIYTAHCVNCAHSRRLPFLRWIYHIWCFKLSLFTEYYYSSCKKNSEWFLCAFARRFQRTKVVSFLSSVCKSDGGVRSCFGRCWGGGHSSFIFIWSVF